MTPLNDIAGATHIESEDTKSAVGEIADALVEMGGSAHRDAVFDRVAIKRGHKFATEGLKLELVEAFDRYCAARKGKPALVYVPLGEGTRRWALTPDVMRSVRQLLRR